MMKRLLLGVGLLLLAGTPTVFAQQHQGVPKDPNVIMGRAFWDINGNGLQDPDEPGVAQMEVNDEASSVYTDQTGYFALRIQPDSHYVRYTVPEGYRLVNTLCLDVSKQENRQIRLVLVPLVKLNHD